MREIELVETKNNNIIRYKDNKEVLHVLDFNITSLEKRKELNQQLNQKFYRSHNKKDLLEKNSNKRMYKKIVVYATLATMALSGTIVGAKVHKDYMVKRAEILSENKTFTSIEIQKGDTITSIAAKYYNELPEDKKQYISLEQYKNEIIATNNLIMPDLITAGNHLIVPHYLEEEINLKK